MPAASDIIQYFRGQIFETPTLPKTGFAGKTVVITGANTGLGFECAKQLCGLDVSTLILGCRDVTKGEAAKQKILRSSKRPDLTVHVWQVDMTSYTSVKTFAAKLRSELKRLDALIANAGISTNDFSVAEDLESTLTVNVVSTFLLALLALPQLKETAAQTGHPTHLTVTGSVVHCFASLVELQTAPEGQVFQSLSHNDQANMAGRYFLSKLIVQLCIQQMAVVMSQEEKHGRSPVILNCPNPGWCKTELFRQDDGGFFGRNLLKLIGRTADIGARTLTSAIAAGPETHGQYVSECRVKHASAFVRSDEGRQLQAQLWRELVQMLEMISPGVADGLS